MAIFAEVTENERIIDRHLRGIHPLLDYDASESQSMISIWFDLIELGLSALYGIMATLNWPTLQRGISAIAELLVYMENSKRFAFEAPFGGYGQCTMFILLGLLESSWVTSY